MRISMEELTYFYKVCLINLESACMSKRMQSPSFLATGRGICEAVDGNLWDGGTTLACPERCGGLSLKDTACSFCFTKSQGL